MSVVGLDIGTYTIKAVELKKSGKSYRVVRAGMIPNDVGRVLPSDPAEREKLQTLIKKLFADFHLPTTNVRVGIPEAMVSTKIVNMPPLTDAELASAVVWQAEQYIPIPAQNLQLEYQVLYRPDKKNLSEQMRVLLVGMTKEMLDQYSSMLYECGLELTGMETNMLGLYRAVAIDPNLPTTLVVHFGASTTEMFVVHNGELAFVYAYPNGGMVLSRALEKGLGLDPAQAESYKRTYGLDATQLEGKVRGALEPVFALFVAEVQKALQYFSGAHQGAQTKRILLSGGSASLPNVIPTIAESLPLEITLFSPFASMTIEKGVEVNPLDLSAFGVAVGLAMGSES
jgi:type IV pilus assembly protein PilM